MVSQRIMRLNGLAALPAELRHAPLVPHRQCSSNAQAASEHRDEQQQAKAADLPIVKPEEPGPEDCCQRGCQECVWDVYWRDMKAYNEQLALREGKPLPLDPFEELERRLAGEGG